METFGVAPASGDADKALALLAAAADPVETKKRLLALKAAADEAAAARAEANRAENSAKEKLATAEKFFSDAQTMRLASIAENDRLHKVAADLAERGARLHDSEKAFADQAEVHEKRSHELADAQAEKAAELAQRELKLKAEEQALAKRVQEHAALTARLKAALGK